MRPQVLLALAAVCVPAIAQANTITAGNHFLPPNTPGQLIQMLMTGTDSYTDSELWLSINGGVGPAPRVTAVFGDAGGSIPVANLAGSIWAGGLAEIVSDPYSTSPSSSGLITAAAFTSAGGLPQNTNGVYVTLTIDTTGVPSGNYPISLTGSPGGVTGLFTILSPPVPVPLEIFNGMLMVTPEPGSVVMGLFALGGLAAVAVRRHRAGRAMFVRSRAVGVI